MAPEGSDFLYDTGVVLETMVEAEISNETRDNTTVLMRDTRWEVVDQCTLPTGEPYYKLRQYRAYTGDAEGTTIKLLGKIVDSGNYFQPFDAATFEMQKAWSEFGMQGNPPGNLIAPKVTLRH